MAVALPSTNPLRPPSSGANGAPGGCQGVSLNGTPVAHVSNFTYLGAIFSEDGSINLEIDTCISKAREKLLSYQFVWEAEHL